MSSGIFWPAQVRLLRACAKTPDLRGVLREHSATAKFLSILQNEALKADPRSPCVPAGPPRGGIWPMNRGLSSDLTPFYTEFV